MESLMSGTLAGTGSFRCEECGYVVTLAATDTLPDCPGCGGSAFTRASLFGPGTRFPRQAPVPIDEEDRERWIERARVVAGEPGEHLAYDDGVLGLRVVHEHVADRRLRVGGDVEVVGEVALRVEIDGEHLEAGTAEDVGERAHRRRLAGAAFLGEDGDGFSHERGRVTRAAVRP